ncbi:MAG: calcium/sodium antiporter [Candidatus Pacebacteria bacterium]|nr:calcium/sodium antiporter [Candidatus Paceibacterota bacterium]
MIVLWILILAASLFGLIKSADYFTEYSEKIGLLLGMSSFIVGATIVAVGTSLPELVSSLFALGAGTTEFVADNIIGSNIANALLILGIAGVVAKKGLKMTTSLIDVDLPFFFMSMAAFGYFALDAAISTTEGIALLLFFVIFVIYNIKSEPEISDKDEMRDIKKNNPIKHNAKSLLKYIGIIIASIGVLALSAKYLIDSILMLSELLNISSSTLTITVVAFGTSLPEILTSVAAVRRGNHGMAIGNVLGSNTFNLLLIAGIPALITPLAIAPATFAIGLPFLVIATFIAIFVMFDNRIRPWEGVGMLFFYLVFIGKITGLM